MPHDLTETQRLTIRNTILAALDEIGHEMPRALATALSIDLAPVVARLLADERERIAREIEADVDRMRRAGGGIFTADFIEGTRYAARIARGQA